MTQISYNNRKEFWGAGKRWGRYYVGPIQFMVCYGAVVGSTLLGGQCMKVSHFPQ